MALSLVVLFVVRLEEIILARLPPEITVGRLSLSLWNRGFILSGVELRGPEKTPCAGRSLAAIEEITGTFELRSRRLSSLRISNLQLATENLRRDCFLSQRERSSAAMSNFVSAAGLKVDINRATIRVQGFDVFGVDAILSIVQNDDQLLGLKAERLSVKNARLRFETQKFWASLALSGPRINTQVAEVMATLSLPHLDKLPRLSSKKVKILAGEGLIKLSASAERGVWTSYTSVELTGIKVTGEPLNKMPFGLFEFTPQSIWPLAEDTEGVFRFAFKSHGDEQKFYRNYAADMQKAFVGKVKANLKKKIPVLPF